MNAFQVQNMCGIAGALIPAAQTTFCAGLVCTAVDKDTCCQPDALCSTLQTSSEIQNLCGDGGTLIAAASSTLCNGVACNALDKLTCCKPPAPPPPTLEPGSGTSNQVCAATKTCSCSNGVVASGDSCIFDKAENCESCKKGYFLKKPKGAGYCASTVDGADRTSQNDCNDVTQVRLAPCTTKATCEATLGESRKWTMTQRGTASCSLCPTGFFQKYDVSTATSCDAWTPCTSAEAEKIAATTAAAIAASKNAADASIAAPTGADGTATTGGGSGGNAGGDSGGNTAGSGGPSADDEADTAADAASDVSGTPEPVPAGGTFGGGVVLGMFLSVLIIGMGVGGVLLWKRQQEKKEPSASPEPELPARPIAQDSDANGNSLEMVGITINNSVNTVRGSNTQLRNMLDGGDVINPVGAEEQQHHERNSTQLPSNRAKHTDDQGKRYPTLRLPHFCCRRVITMM